MPFLFARTHRKNLRLVLIARTIFQNQKDNNDPLVLIRYRLLFLLQDVNKTMFPNEFQDLLNKATSIEIIDDNAHAQAQSETEAALESGRSNVVRRPRKQLSKTRRGGRRLRRKSSPPACRWESSPTASDDSPKVAARRGSFETLVNASLKNMEKQAKSSGIRMPVRKGSIDLPRLDIVLDMDASSPNSVAFTQSTRGCQPKLDTGALIDQVLSELQIFDLDEDYEISCAE